MWYRLGISKPWMVLVLSSLPAHGRSFTVSNNCPFTIWPAIFTDLTVGTATPNMATGWEAPAFNSVTFDVPDNWQSGRIWARRDCDFTTIQGPTSCLDGGCNGGLLCDPHTGTGVPPASVAEWTLSGSGNQDFYDTSLVDGYNLPLSITNNVGCPIADCAVDLGPGCPTPLKGPFDSTGFPVGCQSACQANISGNPNNSPDCCTGLFSTPATCPADNVAFYWYFKGNCPNSYAYAFDESSGTALWECDSSLNADYTLTFCPPLSVSQFINPTNGAVTTVTPPASPTASNPPGSSSQTGAAGVNTSSIPGLPGFGGTVPEYSSIRWTYFMVGLIATTVLVMF